MKTIASMLLLSIGTAAWSANAAGPDLSKLPPPSDKKGLTYAKDIRPILEASCFKCHGDNRPKAGLRLNSLEAVLKGGEDGKVVIPEKSQDSLLVIAAAQIDDETAMPPKRGPGGGGGGGFGPGMVLAPQMMSQGDKDGDKKLSKDEFTALADTWYDKLDPEKTAKVTQQQFTARFGEILPAQGNRGGAQGGGQRPGGGGGPGGFGPGRFIAPGLFTAMDADKDGSLTRVEVKETFAKWLGEWDKDKSGSLSEEQLKAGLTAALPQPNFRGQGGGGGAGGPGVRGPQAGGAGRGGPGQGGPGQGGGGGQRGPGQGGAGQGGPGGQQGGPGGGGQTKPLTAEQVGLVRAWIDQGAK
jgi:hypothetical protein